MRQIDNNALYAESIKNAANVSDLDFLKWFNGGNGECDIIYSGYNDFINQILTPKVVSELKNYDNCLEIGVGGGRLAIASSKFFKKVYGIDIHSNLDKTEKFLKLNGITNVELRRVESCSIPFSEKKFDFIYSFIVLQHVLHIECVESYIEEISRTLSDEGIAVIYVARPKFLWKFKRTNFFVGIDFFIEKLFGFIGKDIYQNEKALVNHVNLEISESYMRRLFNKYNLEILEERNSYSRGDIYKWGAKRVCSKEVA